MPGRPQFEHQAFIDAIKDSAGIISKIAARVGCTWHTAKSYIVEHPAIAQAYHDETESCLDHTESKMLELINGGDDKMVRFHLSRKGRHRGYGERHDVSVSGKLDTTHKLDLEALDAATLAALIAAMGNGEDTQE